jgi:AbrB family transcriptional regulator (stage V sporulation protein T)
MTAHLKMDRSGRVLIPKALRDALALKAGERLEVELEGEMLQLRPAARPLQTVEHAGRLILDAPGPITGDPVEDLRDARLSEVLSSW